MVHVPRKLRHYTERTAQPGIWLGIEKDGRGPCAVVMLTNSRHIIRTIDVSVDETQVLERVRGGPAMPAVQASRIFPRADRVLTATQHTLMDARLAMKKWKAEEIRVQAEGAERESERDARNNTRRGSGGCVRGSLYGIPTGDLND